VLAELDGEEVALVYDVGAGAGTGRLYAIRTRDGAVLGRTDLGGPGQRYVRPLVVGERVWVSSCASGDGMGRLEAYRMTTVRE
jgi:outer membrane protein assembly factor BamB